MSNPVRDKFTELMELFGLTKETQRSYTSEVRCLANHYQQSPDRVGTPLSICNTG
jgi:hypothetical protein